MAVYIRNSVGKFASRRARGVSVWSGSRRLGGAVADAIIGRWRGRQPLLKRPKPKPKPRPKRKPKPKRDPFDEIPRHTRNPEYTSLFRHFLENMDDGSANQTITVFVIYTRTDARYVTAKNLTGTRHLPASMGDMTRARARRLTYGDVADFLDNTGKRYDRDTKAKAFRPIVLGVYALIGEARSSVALSRRKGRSPERQSIARRHLPAAKKAVKRRAKEAREKAKR